MERILFKWRLFSQTRNQSGHQVGFLSSARVAKVRQPLVQSVTKELSVGYLEDESGLPKPSSQYLHTQHSNLLCTLVQQKTLLISIGSCFLKKNKVHIDFTQMNFFIFGLERLNRSLFARSCFLKSWASVSCMNLPWPVDQLVLWAPTGCQVGFAPHHCLCLSFRSVFPFILLIIQFLVSSFSS